MWCGCLFFCFFFSSRRRHTRFDCDWSSDVCSSDLVFVAGEVAGKAGIGGDVQSVADGGGNGLPVDRKGGWMDGGGGVGDWGGQGDDGEGNGGRSGAIGDVDESTGVDGISAEVIGSTGGEGGLESVSGGASRGIGGVALGILAAPAGLGDGLFKGLEVGGKGGIGGDLEFVLEVIALGVGGRESDRREELDIGGAVGRGRNGGGVWRLVADVVNNGGGEAGGDGGIGRGEDGPALEGA